jgi:hypothetical protein
MVKRLSGKLKLVAALTLSVAMAACGGDGGDEDTSTPTPTPTPSTITMADLEGQWVSDQICTDVGAGRWARQLVSATRVSDTKANRAAGTMLYGNASCSGAAEASAVSLGEMTVQRFESGDTGSAAWATVVSSTNTWGEVWVKLSDTKLCILGTSTSFSEVPTLAAAVSGANISDSGKGCYVKV